MKCIALLALAVALFAQPALACRVGGTSFYFDGTPPAGAPEGSTIVEGRLVTNVAQLSHHPGQLDESQSLVGMLVLDDGTGVLLYAWPNSCTHDLFRPPSPEERTVVVGELLPPTNAELSNMRLYGYQEPPGRWTRPGFR